MNDIPNVTSPRELVKLFEEHGLQPLKKLGQNFLIDANIARKITDALDLGHEDLVFEVGPGAGALTMIMANSGVSLIAIEVDRGICRFLEEILKHWSNVKLLHEDALKVNFNEMIEQYSQADQPVKLVSNLPYVISGPFIYGLLKGGFPFKTAVLMLQKEVAHRITAKPGDSCYGGLSVLCQYYTTCKLLFNVSSNVFWPRPGVSSTVVSFAPRSRFLQSEEEAVFWELVQGVFRQRRKMLLNSMGRLYPGLKGKLPLILEEASVPEKARPEELSPAQFALLARITYNYGK